MRKTTLEIDEKLYEQAREVLGTRGLKATVHRAFEEVIRHELRMQLLEQLRTMDGIDLDNPEVMARAWR